MMKKYYTCLLILLAYFSLAGCQSSSQPTSAPTPDLQLVGTWKDVNSDSPDRVFQFTETEVTVGSSDSVEFSLKSLSSRRYKLTTDADNQDSLMYIYVINPDKIVLYADGAVDADGEVNEENVTAVLERASD